MSIRTNPTKAISLLLRQLATKEKDGCFDDLKSELENIRDLFSIVKKHEEELFDILRTVNGHIHNFNLPKLLKEKEAICERVRNSSQKLLPDGAAQSKIDAAAESSNKRFQHKKLTRPLSSSQFLEFDTLKHNCERLDLLPLRCFLSLLFLPENVVIKKRHAIYLWIGVNYLLNAHLQEVERGEYIFKNLLDYKLIVPQYSGTCPIVNKFKVNPWIPGRIMAPMSLKNAQTWETYSVIFGSSQLKDMKYDCLTLHRPRVKLSDEDGFKSHHWRAILNVGSSYLNFPPQWMAKMQKLEVLHLGRWQDSSSHHIEVESEEFLKELRNKKYLKFVNLRGISRISNLPSSFVQLESLEFLDLKACHNLETIPDIALLKNLKHFNVSQCYLLESMPKGIHKLTKLQVLKGFFIGSSSKTSCRISDLENLKQLERLSIHIGSKAVIQDKEFESFQKLSKLESLKISWEVSATGYNDIQIFLPSSIKKLHLEGFPGERIPKFLPFEFPEIEQFEFPFTCRKMLYIMGGKLKTLDTRDADHIRCLSDVEVLHLKYLKHLKVNFSNLLHIFPYLMYAEIKQTLSHSDFEWNKPLRNR
ncbi:hypothetical protein VNO77_39647 [Canavalia gladiata]|uniref:Disease resistance R13L4/SHOC-2-like LRR domain-containing protein n=1 Tax=Canavalia gladiata TaxID=3824 RepID=A0AAN9PQR4_CANGL